MWFIFYRFLVQIIEASQIVQHVSLLGNQKLFITLACYEVSYCRYKNIHFDKDRRVMRLGVLRSRLQSRLTDVPSSCPLGWVYFDIS